MIYGWSPHAWPKIPKITLWIHHQLRQLIRQGECRAWKVVKQNQAGWRINRRRSWSRKKWEKAMEIRWFIGNLGGEATNMGKNTVNCSKLLMLMMISVGFDERFRIGNSSINWDVYEPLVWILPRRYHEEFGGLSENVAWLSKGGYSTWLHGDYELTHNGIGIGVNNKNL